LEKEVRKRRERFLAQIAPAVKVVAARGVTSGKV
jgi:hypothetical protein